jgi:hypothetical protein
MHATTMALASCGRLLPFMAMVELFALSTYEYCMDEEGGSGRKG